MTTYINTREELLENLPKNLIIAELGVFRGDFSKIIFDINKPKLLYLVDIFNGLMGSGDKNGNNMTYIDLSTSYSELLQYFQINQNVEIIKNTTQEFLINTKNETLDAVYIDADHSYNSVIADLELSFLKTKSTGFIMGHDYCPIQFPGVYRAVNEFCTKYNQKIKYIAKDILPSFCIEKQS
jgi:hypothetical protein